MDLMAIALCELMDLAVKRRHCVVLTALHANPLFQVLDIYIYIYTCAYYTYIYMYI